MKKIKIIIILCLLLNPLQAVFAGQIDQNSGLWNVFKLSGNFYKPKLLYLLQLESRLRDTHPVFQQAIVRAGIGYAINPLISVWLGTDYAPKTHTNDNRIFHEQRLWQQVLLKLIQGNHLIFTSRTRLEQRYDFHAHSTAVRLRQRMLLDFQNAIHPGISPVIFDEVFFSLNKPSWINEKTVSQNRLFVGINLAVSKRSVIQIGYLNRYKATLPDDKLEHIIWLAWLINGEV